MQLAAITVSILCPSPSFTFNLSLGIYGGFLVDSACLGLVVLSVLTICLPVAAFRPLTFKGLADTQLDDYRPRL